MINRNRAPQRNQTSGKGTSAGAMRSVVPGSLISICLLVAIAGWCFAVIAAKLPENQVHHSVSELAHAAEIEDAGYVVTRASARLAPGGQFGTVSLAGELVPVELWRTTKPSPLWSVTCFGQGHLADGHNEYVTAPGAKGPRTTLVNTAICNPRVGFIGSHLWGAMTLDVEEARVKQKRVQARQSQWMAADGKEKISLTISPLPANAQPPGASEELNWFDLRLTKHYVLDVETGQLESVRVFCSDNGREVTLFETDNITYLAQDEGDDAMDEVLAAAGL